MVRFLYVFALFGLCNFSGHCVAQEKISQKELAMASLSMLHDLEYISSRNNQVVNPSDLLLLNGSHSASKKVHSKRLAYAKLNQNHVNFFSLEQKSKLDATLGMHTVILAADISVILSGKEEELFDLLNQAQKKFDEDCEKNKEIDDHDGNSPIAEFKLKDDGRVAVQMAIVENGETRSQVSVKWAYLKPDQKVDDLPMFNKPR